MLFSKLDSEEIIYDTDNWRATRDSTLHGIFIYQADYNKGIYICKGYVEREAGYHLDKINLKDIPIDLRDILLREMV